MIGWCWGSEGIRIRMILGFRVDRRLFGEVVLHGFDETDEVAALESGRMRMGLGDLRIAIPRSCAASSECTRCHNDR